MAHHFSVGDFVEFKDEDNTPGFAVGVVTYVHNFGEFITVRNLIEDRQEVVEPPEIIGPVSIANAQFRYKPSLHRSTLDLELLPAEY